MYTMLPVPGRTEPTFRLPRQTTPSRSFDRVVDDLRTELDGRLVRPGDPDWDQARAAWNLAVDQHPGRRRARRDGPRRRHGRRRGPRRSACGSHRSPPGTTPPPSATSPAPSC